MRRRLRRRDTLTFSLLLQLGYGVEDPPDTLSEPELRGAWLRHRDELLAEWARRYPGENPWAYRRFGP